MIDLVVRGDRVVTPHGVAALDIGIRGGAIALLAPMGTIDAERAGRIIDARGKVVVPGGIDPHMHCKWQSPGNNYFSAGPEQVSRAALFGGTTTFIDFAIWRSGQTIEETVRLRDADWEGQCHCDYAYHILLNGAIPGSLLEQIPETISAGFPSFKMYTTDGRPQRSGWKLDFGDIWEVLKVLARHDGIACLHAEDNDIVMHMYRKLYAENRTGFEHMAEVHSALSEDLSFRRIIRLAEHVEGAGLYMMHTSAATGVEAIEESRRKGYPVYGETLHQYALFTRHDYERPNGQIYHTYPSLKEEKDHAALWDGLLRTGAISTIATDGICTPLALKVKGRKIDDVLGGNVGCEPRLGVMYTEIVSKRGASLETFVNATSAHAARIMGLYPRKGALAVGSDADIAILDVSRERTLREEDLHESDYSPWAGYSVTAWPAITLLRGKVMVENGTFLGNASDGKRVARKLAPEVLSGPCC
jgi:dihydropyrimidinase